MNAKDIGHRIRETRKRLRHTQKVFARLIGVTAAAVSAYETGDSVPSMETLVKLTKIGNTSSDWILTGGHMAGTPDGKLIQLTREELAVIEDLRQADPEVRELVMRLVKAIICSKNSAS